MQSIKNIYKIGPGPSSSHTFGPMKASSYMLEKYPEADRFDVILYGSLALTGKGHLTDMIIKKTEDPNYLQLYEDNYFTVYERLSN